MMNKVLKRTTISLISTLRQNNILKFQCNTVKFFGAKKKNIIESLNIKNTPEKIKNKNSATKKGKVQESSFSSSQEEEEVKTDKVKKLPATKKEIKIEEKEKSPVKSVKTSNKQEAKSKNKNIASPQATTKKSINSTLEVKPSKEKRTESTISKKVSKSLDKAKTNPQINNKMSVKKVITEEKLAEDKIEIKKRGRNPKSEVKNINKEKIELKVDEQKEESKSKKLRSPKTIRAHEPFPNPDLKTGNLKLGWMNSTSPLKMYDLNGSGMYGIYEDYIKTHIPTKSKELIFKEQRYGCNNYAPLPIVLNKGNGVFLQDVENNIFIDFLAAYSAVNHGHNNQNVIKDMFEQANTLYMTSRAFYNDKLGEAAELVCNVFGYEKVLFMNGGVEAGESAVKIARRWGYRVKNIQDDQAKIVFAKGNFWGRTTYACATSDDPSRYEGFGPLQKDSHYLVEYNNIQALEKLLNEDNTICAVFLEPIQGENGVIIPDKGYLTKVSELCKKYNVLFISDEIQTGCGRAGHLLFCNEEGVKPDLVCLGKSLSSGLYPVSAVLSSRVIMDLIKPGEHGSTYGGNPLAASVVLSSVRDILNKQLVENSYDKGLLLGNRLIELKDSKIIKEIRGRGLMFGLELHEDLDISAYHLSVWLMERGILTKPTKKHILRLTPPISISTEELNAAADIIIAVIRNAEKLVSDDQVERPKTVFNFTKVDENYHILLDKSMNKNTNEVEGKNENLKIASALKNNSFSLDTSNDNETKDLKGDYILDQIIQSNAGKNKSNKISVSNEDFDPNPYLKNNINKLDEQLFENDEDDHKRKLTELLFTYLENPFRYDKEDASISFNKDLDLYRLLVRTLDIEDIKALDKKISLTSNLEIQNKNLYKKIVNMIQDFKDYTESPTDNHYKI